jgi:hypothetical protein
MVADRKPLVFISHLTEEGEVAVLLRDLVEHHFLDMIEMFISSDERSIEMGRRWLELVTERLKRCAIEIVLCSPISVDRPWIHFEAGAGWIRDIPVIPLCHSGMSRDQLPVPLNMLQAANATDSLDLDRVFRVLAEAIGARNPTVDFTEFVGAVRAFEERYIFWNSFNSAFAYLRQANPADFPSVMELLGRGERARFILNQTDVPALMPYMNFLQSQNVLQADTTQGMSMSVGGPGIAVPQTTWVLTPLERFSSIYEDDNFAFNPGGAA